MKKLVLGCFIILAITLCTKKEPTQPEELTIQDFLPMSEEIAGWPKGADSWYATNENDLYAEINGEGVIYIDNGFVEAINQSYEGKILGDNASIIVRIFDQGNANNCKSVFEEIVLQLSNPVHWATNSATEAKAERFPLSQIIIFRKLKYYVSCSVSSGTDEALDILKTFANNIDSKIK